MGWLDKVPGAGNLYIGGLYALRRHEAIRQAGITHVVSVLRWPIEEGLVQPFRHLQIDVDDEDEENLLEFFPTSNRFIEDALQADGNVLVHCAMGKSRSATVVVAYLMHKFRKNTLDALSQLREARGVCEPNLGFMRQLDLYEKMGCPDSVEQHPEYQRWLYARELQASRSVSQAPETDKVRFEDEHAVGSRLDGFEFRCKKCRRALATSKFLVKHQPKEKPDDPSSTPLPPSACSHLFLDALSWMRPEIEQGKLDGRLECPKCKTNVGKYAWQGMQCSCGDWVVPGISLAKGRIDEVGLTRKSNAAALGIRMPPGASKSPSERGNL